MNLKTLSSPKIKTKRKTVSAKYAAKIVVAVSLNKFGCHGLAKIFYCVLLLRLEPKSTGNKCQIEKPKNKKSTKAEQRLSSRRGLWFKSYQ